MAKGKGNGAGRPTQFTPELGAEICLRLMTYKVPENSITRICMSNDMPCRTTVYLWLLDAASPNASEEKKEFLTRYNTACNVRLDNYFEETLDVAYDDSGDLLSGKYGKVGNSTAVSRSTLKVNTIKWALSKLNPEKYGDRITQELTGDLTISPADALILALTGDEEKE